MCDAVCDAELVRQVQEGNTDAFMELLKRHAKGAYLDCLAAFGRVWDREDLAQELALRAWRALRGPGLLDPGRFRPWLSSIALNICRHWFKDRDNRFRPMPDPDDVPGPPEKSPVSAVDHADEVRHLMRRIQALPEEYRKTLLAYYSQAVTYAALAAELNVSAATVNFRLWKAREMLRQDLGATAR